MILPPVIPVRFSYSSDAEIIGLSSTGHENDFGRRGDGLRAATSRRAFSTAAFARVE
jgi:hypothetical protein